MHKNKKGVQMYTLCLCAIEPCTYFSSALKESNDFCSADHWITTLLLPNF